jgi:hypothetical protein
MHATNEMRRTSPSSISMDVLAEFLEFFFVFFTERMGELAEFFFVFFTERINELAEFFFVFFRSA